MENFKEKYKNLIFKNKSLCVFVDNIGFENDDEFLDCIANILSENECIISFVKKDITDKKYIELCSKIKFLCSEFNSLFLISSRADIAFITESSGIILSKDDITVKDAKKIIHENSIIGIITDNLSENYINNDDIDFIVCENEYEKCILNTDKPIFIKTKHDFNIKGNFKTFMIKS